MHAQIRPYNLRTTPTEYYSTRGHPPEPINLTCFDTLCQTHRTSRLRYVLPGMYVPCQPYLDPFKHDRNDNTRSTITAYYSTQGRPPDISAARSPQCSFPA
eukprot:5428754-Ditylum_brightwellii.AAC.1